MGTGNITVTVTANAQVVRVMPQKYRVDAVRALRFFSAEHNRGLLDALKTLFPADWPSRLQTALGQIDQDAVFRAHRARVVEQVWDGTSPVNGVPAQEMRGTHRMGPGDGAYLIAIDGQVVVFQPVHGVTDPAELARRAQEHADQIAAAYAHQDIEDALARMLLG